MTPRGPRPKTDDKTPKRLPVGLYLLPEYKEMLSKAAVAEKLSMGEIVEQALAKLLGRKGGVT